MAEKSRKPVNILRTGYNDKKEEKEPDIKDDPLKAFEIPLEDAPKEIRELAEQIKENVDQLMSPEDTKPHRFSEKYEQQMRENLVKQFGEKDADEILQARRQIRRELHKAHDEEAAAAIPASVGAEKKRGGRKHNFFAKVAGHIHTKTAKVAIAVAAFCCVFGTVSVGVSAFKIPIVEFFTKGEDKYTAIALEESIVKDSFDYPETIEKKYALEKTADGYKEIATEEFDMFYRIIYQDDSGHEYIFTQKTRNINSGINTEDAHYEDCPTMYGDGFYYESKGTCQLIWYFEDYTFMLSGDLDKDEMLGLISSLRGVD